MSRSPRGLSSAFNPDFIQTFLVGFFYGHRGWSLSSHGSQASVPRSCSLSAPKHGGHSTPCLVVPNPVVLKAVYHDSGNGHRSSIRDNFEMSACSIMAVEAVCELTAPCHGHRCHPRPFCAQCHSHGGRTYSTSSSAPLWPPNPQWSSALLR